MENSFDFQKSVLIKVLDEISPKLGSLKLSLINTSVKVNPQKNHQIIASLENDNVELRIIFEQEINRAGSLLKSKRTGGSFFIEEFVEDRGIEWDVRNIRKKNEAFSDFCEQYLRQLMNLLEKNLSKIILEGLWEDISSDYFRKNNPYK